MPLSGGAPGAVSPDLMEGAFPWSADRRLTWSDFVGRPDVTSPAVALTVYHVSIDTPCHAGELRPDVVTRFLPRASWVNLPRLTPATSSLVLQHEQSHFDLSEVLVRQSIRELRALARPCDLTNADVRPVLDAFGSRSNQMQQQYDRETGHGTDVRRQREWTARIDAWLREPPR
jgi:predicted secreted Zn-dependent protease